jgi:hemerythrin-like domain-containing protein
MPQKRKPRKNSIHVIGDEDAEMLRKAKELDMTLNSLRHEGKYAWGQNLKKLSRILKYFDSDVARHMRVEEKVLFPFLRKHVPKLEFTLYLLKAEHADFEEKIKFLKKLIVRLKRKLSGHECRNTLNEACATGVYVIYLLRNHVEVESRNVTEMARDCLKRDENKMLGERLSNYLRGRNGR